MLGLPGHSAAVAQNFRDKAQMKDVLHSAGVPCARHRLVERAEEAHAFVAEVGYPVVVKPPAGAGGARTFRLDGAADLERYLSEYPPATRGVSLFEEFIRGTEHSFDSVLLDGQAVWYSISRYMPSPLEVMENPWIQWCVLLPRHIDTPEYASIRDVAFRALTALGMRTGLSHMEWFRRADGSVAVSEVGARPPGAQFTTLLSYAHDLDFYSAWPRLMIFNEFTPPPRVYAAGAAYVRGQGTGRVKQIRGLDQAQRELGHLVVEPNCPRRQSRRPATRRRLHRPPRRTEVVEAALSASSITSSWDESRRGHSRFHRSSTSPHFASEMRNVPFSRSSRVELNLRADLVGHGERRFQIGVTQHDEPVRDERCAPVAPACADRQQRVPHDVLAEAPSDVVQTLDRADRAVALRALVDRRHVVIALDRPVETLVCHRLAPGSDTSRRTNLI